MPAVTIRQLEERDVDECEGIYREAFSIFLKIPPEKLRKGSYVRGRFFARNGVALVAETQGRLLGSAFAANWGSVGVLGPCTTRMKGFTANAGALLVGSLIDVAKGWGVKHLVGYTFCDSPRHLDFFQGLGIWPRHITAIFTQAVRKVPPVVSGWTRLSAAGPGRAAVLAQCRDLTGRVWPGLDLTLELDAAERQGVGDTLVHHDEGGQLDAFALCHAGPGSEANENAGYVKFATVRHDGDEARRFEQLLLAVEAHCHQNRLASFTVGMNTAHHDAYRALVARRMMIIELGVSLHYDNAATYKLPGLWVVDDWR